MGSDSTKSLDTEQVLLIVESCARHGVTLLKFRDLELAWGQPAPQMPETIRPPSSNAPLSPPDAAMSEVEAPKKPVPHEPWEQPELDLREEQIAELQLTDPLAAEEMIERGELDDAGQSDDGDEE